MTVFADLLWVFAAVPLLHLVAGARPMRGEAFVGMHLLTLPIAGVLTLACGLHVVASPLPWQAANWLLLSLAPGHVVAMMFLPAMAFGRRGAGLARVACLGALVAVALVGHGGALHPGLQATGAAFSAGLGVVGSIGLAAPLWRLLLRRIRCRFRVGPRGPSQFELDNAEFQRGQWQKVPADAGVAVLLGFTRSFAPEVRRECLDRLAARGDLVPELAAILTGPNAEAAFHFVVHDCPIGRAALAPAVRTMLAVRRRDLEVRRVRGDDELPFPTVGAIECGLAVLEDGGDVTAELEAWRDLLSRMHGGAPMAKTLSRWLRKLTPV